LVNQLLVGPNSQSRSLTKLTPVTVPSYREPVTMIMDILKGKPIPLFFGNQRIDLKSIISPRPQSHQPGNHQVCKSRVVIVTTARIVSVQPVTVNLVMIFSDIRVTIFFVGFGIGLQLAEEIFLVHRVVLIIIQQPA